MAYEARLATQKQMQVTYIVIKIQRVINDLEIKAFEHESKIFELEHNLEGLQLNFNLRLANEKRNKKK